MRIPLLSVLNVETRYTMDAFALLVCLGFFIQRTAGNQGELLPGLAATTN